MTQSCATNCDVLICGAGIAGLTLARQIRREMPSLSLCLIDRQERPLPRAAFKVGESTTEIGAQYFTDTLGLSAYLDESHLRKLGLRFFFGNTDAGDEFHKRPEVGVSRFIPPYAYQIDRGRIENDLRELLASDGVSLQEGSRVKEIVLGSEGTEHHVLCEDSDGVRTQLGCRWVIDALGRHSLLRRKQALTKRIAGGDSAWVRVAERVDVADFVAGDRLDWHQRVPDRTRYYSTNHLVGEGYWVWLIPLPGDFTSIGIVTHPRYHGYKEYNTERKFRRWLQGHERHLARRLDNVEFLDFRKMPRYSFSTSRVFSAHRWACTGEASAFPDPLYSPNFELIPMNNSIACELIGRDMDGSLLESEVAAFNRFFLAYAEGLGDTIRSMYSCLGNGAVAAMKVLWDTLTSWSFHAPLYNYGLFLDATLRNSAREDTGRFLFLARRVQRLFQEWARLSTGKVKFEYMDFLALPYYSTIRRRGLVVDRTSDIRRLHGDSLAFFEELAQVLFLIALTDTRPALLGRLPKPLWINPWGISLEPGRWNADKLFEPATKPRTLLPVLEPLQKMITIPGIHEVDVR